MKQSIYPRESAVATPSNSLRLRPLATGSTQSKSPLESRMSRVLADKANNLIDPSIQSYPTEEHVKKMSGLSLSEKGLQTNPRKVYPQYHDSKGPSLLAMDEDALASSCIDIDSNPLSSTQQDVYTSTSSFKQVEAREGCVNPVSRILWDTEDEEMGEQQQHHTELMEGTCPKFRVVSPAKGSNLPNLSVARPMPVRPILLA